MSISLFQGMALVSDCPKNKTEISKASKRLNCGNDSFGNNQYICIPNEEKTSLVELCFDGIIGLNERGMYDERLKKKYLQIKLCKAYQQFSFVSHFGDLSGCFFRSFNLTLTVFVDEQAFQVVR